MMIDITQEQATACWVVHMEGVAVEFKTLEGAQAFVRRLRTRIDAPHAWPINVDPPPCPASGPRSPIARRHGCNGSADLVESRVGRKTRPASMTKP